LRVAIKYAKVLRLEIWVRGPKGDERDRLRDEAAEDAWGGDNDAESLRSD
jgi:hypothetical protein